MKITPVRIGIVRAMSAAADLEEALLALQGVRLAGDSDPTSGLEWHARKVSDGLSLLLHQAIAESPNIHRDSTD